jgi:hypothetical protein
MPTENSCRSDKIQYVVPSVIFTYIQMYVQDCILVEISKIPSQRYEKHRTFVVKSLGIDGIVHGFESRLESLDVCFRGVLRQSPRARCNF